MSRDRFKPTRAGVINVWDYLDEEFTFADGRLVLRGHNGSGKTKALEVLFPFILDGHTDPRRLDPFSGQNRTMKSNLLYRGQDAEYGFVWMEFARPGKGPLPETVTLVIGLRAQQHRDGVTTSFFVTDKRLGVDFGLLAADNRPLTERQLKAALGEGAHHTTAADYRAAVDARLFGLGDRYIQLLDLLLALRRPLLAKDLDPEKVSDTLTAGLSPLDEKLVDQAARDFANLSAVQRRFDDATAAHTAVETFTGAYSSYLTAHARHRSAGISAALARADEHISALAAHTDSLAAATTEGETLAAEVARTAAQADEQEAVRKGLAESEALRDAQALELELRHSDTRGRELAEAARRLHRQGEEITHLRGEADGVARHLEQRRAAIADLLAELEESADRAGITGDGEGPADTGVDAARARAAARAADLDEVRAHLADLHRTEAERGRADADAARSRTALEEAEEAGTRAEAGLEAARTAVADELAAWARRWAEGPGAVCDRASLPALDAALDTCGQPGAPTLPEVFTDLTDPARTDAIRHEHRLAADRERTTADLAAVRAERTEIAAERDDAPPADRARTASRAGRPGAPLWRLVRFADGLDPARAAGIEGALDAAGLLTAWVHPDPATARAALEALLPDAHLVPAPQGAATQGNAPAPTLADVLVAEDQDHVPTDVIDRLLTSIPLTDTPVAPGTSATPAVPGASQTSTDPHTSGVTPVLAAPDPSAVPGGSPAFTDPSALGATSAPGTPGLPGGSPASTGPGAPGGGSAPEDPVTPTVHIGTGGHFRLGVLVGAGPKAAPEFIGATNRAARRRERLADLDARIDALTADLSDLEERLGAAADRVKAFALARTDLPDTAPVARALRTVEHHATLVAGARAAREQARLRLDSATADVDAHRTRLRAAAAERSLPTAPADLDAVAAALDAFRAAHRALLQTRTDVERAEHDLAERTATIERLTEAHTADTRAHEERAAEHAETVTRLQVRQDSVDAPAREVIDRLRRTEEDLVHIRSVLADLRERATAARDDVIRAEAGIDSGRSSLLLALEAVFEHCAGLAPLTRPGTRTLLGIDGDRTWPAPALWPDAEEAADRITAAVTGGGDPDQALRSVLPPGAADTLDAFTAAVGTAPVAESTLKTAGTRMSEALRVFTDALAATADGYRIDHEADPGGIITVHVGDETGRNPLPAFARTVAERVEEQDALLRREERGVLEDELLSAIAQQIHERVRTARDLVRSMDTDTRSRPMTSGTRIGIRWTRADHLTGRNRAVADLLRRDAVGLGPSGLTELRGLLRELIREYHAAHPRATYKQVLAAVLDYREWYRFELRKAVPGQDEVRLTKAKHEEMSGGEKSAAIHLPLFAAANALYSSARATCPRLIALDEAFAGIDDRYKPELMGLTVTFDLDVFMTGHDLWVHYDSVPMAAHYDMHHDKALQTVSAMFMLWDGAQVIDADAGFSGNDALSAHLLGITPSRFVPLAAEGTLPVDLADTASTTDPAEAD
ncbi:SbcC/MukB-like Walker B domain-containing protein [Nocardiopsis protaetiae]|uniref:SbcC/MukB-like Walker B domain-containing protein n=1 Tax=Nocardiopsis protaetiae TaxID=3382270 RepID=UPI00387B60C7